jgi:8-oxo-dGTP pyrophosphatase MutT (NUDIX family)
VADSDRVITEISGTIVYQNRWMTIHEDNVRLADGKPGTYGYLESKDGVNIVPINDTGEVCMVRSFRYPTQSWGWEFPAGGGEGQEAEVAARRELEEETGLLADDLEMIGKTVVCNGFMTEWQQNFIARGVRSEGHQNLEGEAITTVQFFTFEEIEAMIDSGEVNDNQTITALYLAQRWLRKEKAAHV